MHIRLEPVVVAYSHYWPVPWAVQAKCHEAQSRPIIMSRSLWTAEAAETNRS